MKRTKEEKRLAVLIHNAAFEQAKDDLQTNQEPYWHQPVNREPEVVIGVDHQEHNLDVGTAMIVEHWADKFRPA